MTIETARGKNIDLVIDKHGVKMTCAHDCFWMCSSHTKNTVTRMKLSLRRDLECA